MCKLTSGNFSTRLKQTNLASKSHFANKVKKADLSKNELNDFINEFSIISGAKYFSAGIFQNYLELILAKQYINYLSGLICGNLMQYEKKLLKI